MSRHAVPEGSGAGIGRLLGSHPSLARAAATWAVVEGVQHAVERSRSYYRTKLAYTVTVRESDSLFRDVQEWTLKHLQTADRRHLEASVSSGSALATVEPATPSTAGAADAPTERLFVTFTDPTPRPVTIDGHRVTVRFERMDATTRSSDYRPDASIEFSCRSQAGQQAVLALLQQLSVSRTHRAPVLQMPGRWGGWQRRSDLPGRTWESVVLPHDQAARIEADLAGFLDAEPDYVARGIPWHRGYLFHGPPGTGKTSLVKALANRFELDLWYVPVADLKEEASLMDLLGDVTPRSLLLLEDIDTALVAQDRDAGGKPGTISTGSLLNALDGVATPHGLVTVMTTNRIEVLDDALIRAGRMDCVERIDHPGAEEVARLFEVFHGRPPAARVQGPALGRVSQAVVAECMKRHMGDPDAAELALVDLLQATVPDPVVC